MESVTKQMLSYLVRAIFLFIGGLLVSRNLLAQETLDLLANSVVAHLVGIILIVAPFVLRYFKAQKNVAVFNETIKEAVKADPRTPISVVRQRVIATIQGKK